MPIGKHTHTLTRTHINNEFHYVRRVFCDLIKGATRVQSEAWLGGGEDWAATKYCPALPTPFRCRFFLFVSVSVSVFSVFFVAVAALRPNIIDELSPRHFVDCCRARNFRFRLSERQPVTRDSCLHILHTHTHTRTLWGNYLHVCVCVCEWPVPLTRNRSVKAVTRLIILSRRFNI